MPEGNTKDELGIAPIWPKRTIAGSTATYWELHEADLANMQVTVTALHHDIRIFTESHVLVSGTIFEVIHETDGDRHIWLALDGGKARLACEVTPQQPLAIPPAGTYVEIAGILRYDLAHAWWEIHPVDSIATKQEHSTASTGAVDQEWLRNEIRWAASMIKRYAAQSLYVEDDWRSVVARADAVLAHLYDEAPDG